MFTGVDLNNTYYKNVAKMEKTMDVRVKVTKKMIFEAFLNILKNKPIAKTTVKEICFAAGINRTTFYKYYKDTYDLLEQIEDELIDNLQANLEHIDKSSLSDIFTIILTDISEKRELYVALFSESQGKVFRGRLFSLCYEDNKKVLLEYFPGLPEDKQEWMYYFIADGCNSVLKQWIQGGFKQSIEELVDFLIKLIGAVNKFAEL